MKVSKFTKLRIWIKGDINRLYVIINMFCLILALICFIPGSFLHDKWPIHNFGWIFISIQYFTIYLMRRQNKKIINERKFKDDIKKYNL